MHQHENYSTITAAEIQIWDEIQHANGETWEVVTTPQCIDSVIEFQVFVTSDTMENNTRIVRFHSNWRFILISRKPQNSVPSEKDLVPIHEDVSI